MHAQHGAKHIRLNIQKEDKQVPGSRVQKKQECVELLLSTGSAYVQEKCDSLTSVALQIKACSLHAPRQQVSPPAPLWPNLWRAGQNTRVCVAHMARLSFTTKLAARMKHGV
jgi:hypothetical protein